MNTPPILLSAYACEPNRGSEPAVGWNTALHVAQYHPTWVITRANNRHVIESVPKNFIPPNLHFVYVDLPKPLLLLKKTPYSVQWYYDLWQRHAASVALKLHQEHRFALVHHVTFAKFWAPSWMWKLNVPFLIGPVGGGDDLPRAFFSTLSPSARMYEYSRLLARTINEHRPALRKTISQADLILASTPATVDRLERFYPRSVALMSQVGLDPATLDQLAQFPPVGVNPSLRFIAIGNLLGLKGYHLALHALAAVSDCPSLKDAQLWFLGQGPERKHLERLSRDLNLADRVTFHGHVPQTRAYELLAQCDVLLHPSFHDSGGFACAEALAAGRPMICLDRGGPALMIRDAASLTSPVSAGLAVPATHPGQTIRDLPQAMRKLAEDPVLLTELSRNARLYAQRTFSWPGKATELVKLYQSLIASYDHPGNPGRSS